jgi:hypothetical protein
MNVPAHAFPHSRHRDLWLLCAASAAFAILSVDIQSVHLYRINDLSSDVLGGAASPRQRPNFA